jgi:hypothetical protein
MKNLDLINAINKFKLPELHSDLRNYLQGDELCHPLIQVEGLIPALYRRANQVYKQRQQQISKHEPQPQNEWARYLPHLSLTERQIQFIINESGKQDPAYFRTIGQIWTAPEPLGCTSGFLELLLGIHPSKPTQTFSPNVLHIMTLAEQQQLAKLPEKLTVYRGHHERLLNGISWTMNCNIALQYAVGWPEHRFISVGIVNKSSVIALIDRWSETEILAPTSAVQDIVTQIAA